jgi:hypothetical protein
MKNQTKSITQIDFMNSQALSQSTALICEGKKRVTTILATNLDDENGNFEKKKGKYVSPLNK